MTNPDSSSRPEKRWWRGFNRFGAITTIIWGTFQGLTLLSDSSAQRAIPNLAQPKPEVLPQQFDTLLTQTSRDEFLHSIEHDPDKLRVFISDYLDGKFEMPPGGLQRLEITIISSAATDLRVPGETATLPEKTDTFTEMSLTLFGWPLGGKKTPQHSIAFTTDHVSRGFESYQDKASFLARISPLLNRIGTESNQAGSPMGIEVNSFGSRRKLSNADLEAFLTFMNIDLDKLAQSSGNHLVDRESSDISRTWFFSSTGDHPFPRDFQVKACFPNLSLAELQDVSLDEVNLFFELQDATGATDTYSIHITTARCANEKNIRKDFLSIDQQPIGIDFIGAKKAADALNSLADNP